MENTQIVAVPVDELPQNLVEQLCSGDGWRGENWVVNRGHGELAFSTRDQIRSMIYVG